MLQLAAVIQNTLLHPRRAQRAHSVHFHELGSTIQENGDCQGGKERCRLDGICGEAGDSSDDKETGENSRNENAEVFLGSGQGRTRLKMSTSEGH